MKKILYILSIFLIVSCQSETDSPAIKAAKETYTTERNPANGLELIKAYIAYVNENKDGNKAKNAEHLQNAIKVANSENLTDQKIALMHIAVRDFYESTDTPENIFELGQTFEKANNPLAAQSMYLGLQEAFPTHNKTAVASAKVTGQYKSLDAMIKGLATAMFNDSTNVINRATAAAYVNVCEAHALTLPQDSLSPTYLHRAAEIARTMGHINKAMNVYDWLLVKYPEDRLAGQALFLKAQTYDDLLKDEEKAKPLYEEFLKKYPNSEFSDDAVFQLEMLGKTDEEVLQVILKRAAERKAEEAG